MRNIVELTGELLAELFGAAGVVVGLCGALVLFKKFADGFISFFV